MQYLLTPRFSFIERWGFIFGGSKTTGEQDADLQQTGSKIP
jgi:hypothetical protein